MYVTTLCLGKKLVSDSIRTENRMHNLSTLPIKEMLNIFCCYSFNWNIKTSKHPGKLVKRKDTIYGLLTNHLRQFINKISITSLVTVDETNNFITNRIEGPTLKSQTYLQSLIFPRKQCFLTLGPLIIHL